MFNWSGVANNNNNNPTTAGNGNSRIVNYHQNGKTGGTLLFKAIEQRQWKSMLSRMTMSPHEVSTFVYRNEEHNASISNNNNRSSYININNNDNNNNNKTKTKILLPLHAALERQPPSVIISALVAAYPRALSQKCDGNLPLHIALKNGVPFEILYNLVYAYPKSLTKKDGHDKDPISIYQSKVMSWTDEEERKLIEALLSSSVEDIVAGKDGQGDVGDDGGDDKTVVDKDIDIDTDTIKDTLQTTLREEGWLKSEGLTVIVIGASGDLAKKKTYPSLLRLFYDNLLPENTTIWGFARSAINDDELRDRLKPYLEKSGDYTPDTINAFLEKCYYQRGKSYGDDDAYKTLATIMSNNEEFNEQHLKGHNRLFYFAIPPNVFGETGVAIKQNAMADKGWTRVIIEKPFGRDLQSCEELLGTLSKYFDEEQMFRIDHYLGKEMVQNLIAMRFGNLWFERLWNRDNIQCVMLTFKEPFGTDGRGGYFDKYGIIRDIIQNHLLQVLSLLAMEPPSTVDGPEAGESIRDAKVQVLTAIPPITLDDCFLGQYEGYTDDPTIENKDTNTPTFAVLRCFVNTPRWAGVPFIFKAGKAVNERKAEMRIQFKDAPAAKFLFESKCPRNELVLRMQPNEAIYMKTNVKTPGFSSNLIQKELEVNYEDRFVDANSDKGTPDAYTRLILDVLRGKSATFVREDELRRAWEIFTPLLHKIEQENIRPVSYECKSRGPPAADDFIERKSGYVRNDDYVFANGKVTSKDGAQMKSKM